MKDGSVRKSVCTTSKILVRFSCECVEEAAGRFCINLIIIRFEISSVADENICKNRRRHGNKSQNDNAEICCYADVES